MPCHSAHQKTQAQLSGYISACDTNRVVCPYTTTTRPSHHPYRYTYDAKRITSEAGIATSEFKLLLRVAAFFVLVCLAVLALPAEVAEVELGTLRVELTTAEVVGIEAFAAPCWTSKYMPWKSIRRKKKGKLASRVLAASGERTHSDGLAELAGLMETSGKDVRVNKKSWMHNNVVGRTSM